MVSCCFVVDFRNTWHRENWPQESECPSLEQWGRVWAFWAIWDASSCFSSQTSMDCLGTSCGQCYCYRCVSCVHPTTGRLSLGSSEHCSPLSSCGLCLLAMVVSLRFWFLCHVVSCLFCSALWALSRVLVCIWKTISAVTLYLYVALSNLYCHPPPPPPSQLLLQLLP